jgi:hypothetical protein
MKTLLILNDPASGTERSYNGLRLAGALAKRNDDQLNREPSPDQQSGRGHRARVTSSSRRDRAHDLTGPGEVCRVERL